MGIGDWGLGIGDWANPQSPIPNPHFKLYLLTNFIKEEQDLEQNECNIEEQPNLTTK